MNDQSYQLQTNNREKKRIIQYKYFASFSPFFYSYFLFLFIFSFFSIYFVEFDRRATAVHFLHFSPSFPSVHFDNFVLIDIFEYMGGVD